MPRPRMNALRKMLMWFFDAPGTAYVTVNIAADFARCVEFLAEVNDARAEGEDPVSVHHLVCAAVTRVLSEFPDANARIVGRQIERLDNVGVAMPVNLLGHEGGKRFETALMILEEVDGMSLKEVSAACRRNVKRERSGDSTNPLMGTLAGVADRVPYVAIAALLNGYNRASRHPLIGRQIYKQGQVSTVVSNVGAALTQLDGGWFRGASMAPPQFNIFHVGTVWGVSAVQDEVVPVMGEVEVRPILPVVLVFDHRLIDGVRAGQIASRFIALLQDPVGTFGEGASARIGRGR